MCDSVSAPQIWSSNNKNEERKKKHNSTSTAFKSNAFIILICMEIRKCQISEWLLAYSVCCCLCFVSFLLLSARINSFNNMLLLKDSAVICIVILSWCSWNMIGPDFKFLTHTHTHSLAIRIQFFICNINEWENGQNAKDQTPIFHLRGMIRDTFSITCSSL